MRAGRCLGRVHAAQGEHALAQAAFEAALQLATTGRFLVGSVRVVMNGVQKTPDLFSHCAVPPQFSEVLAVRAMALLVKGEEAPGRQRLAEVVGRMQLGGEVEAERAALVAALLAP